MSVSVAQSRGTRRRRICFGLAKLLLVIGVTELVAWTGLHLSHQSFSFRTLRVAQQRIAEGVDVSDGATEVIHPYPGWVHNPDLAPTEEMHGHAVPVNRSGFRDDSASVYSRSARQFLLGIAGGSVAWELSWDSEQWLKQALADLPALEGRQIRIIRMASPGYKQPQQLMAYNYLLALGAEFDVIVLSIRNRRRMPPS